MNLLKAFRTRFSNSHFNEGFLFTVIGVLSAIVCSGYARIFSFAEQTSQIFFQSMPVLSYFVAPIGMMISFALIYYISPGATGSGIPQVLACIEIKDGSLIRKFLRKTVVIIKILSNVIAVLVGAATGREGPSLQIAAAVSYNTGKFAEKFGFKVRTEQLLVAGAAGGLAAAFNTPIGGVVFAIEELSKEHVRTFRDVLLLSVVIAGLSAQLINGSYLFLGTPIVPEDHSFRAMGLVAICALFSGILGGLFTKILLFFLKWRSEKKIITQFLIIGAIGIVFALTYQYLGSRSLYSGKESIHVVLFESIGLPWYEFLTRFFMPIITSMTGVAGGIFAPALSAGAAFGGTFAGLVDPSLMVILGLSGMVGFLTGITHTPITSFILVLEMTDRHSVVFPMMLAALTSSIGAHLVSKTSFYEQVVEDIKKKTQIDSLLPDNHK